MIIAPPSSRLGSSTAHPDFAGVTSVTERHALAMPGLENDESGESPSPEKPRNPLFNWLIEYLMYDEEYQAFINNPETAL